MFTGYDAHGNFLPPQKLVDEIERLRTVLKQIADTKPLTDQASFLIELALNALVVTHQIGRPAGDN